MKKKKKNPLTIEEQIQETVQASEDMPQIPVLQASEELPEAAEEESKEEVLPQDLELVQVRSIIESILLAYDKPVNISLLKEVFKGTGTSTDLIKRALSDLMVEYAGAERGISISEVSGGYQLRTKSENQIFVRRLTKGRPFKLSGPSLEVLSIVAYKQPIIKAEIDSIRGVESGHLVRALMDRSLVKFVGKSELPGKPMLYGTTRKFLEIFGLRDLRELPSLAEIDELLPEGMLEEEEQKPEREWGSIQEMSMQYQQDHQKLEEWEKITEEISKIETTTNFFEEEKKREKERRDQERAESIREAILNGQEVPNKDRKWLQKYETHLAEAARAAHAADGTPGEASESSHQASGVSDGNATGASQVTDSESLRTSQVTDSESLGTSQVTDPESLRTSQVASDSVGGSASANESGEPEVESISESVPTQADDFKFDFITVTEVPDEEPKEVSSSSPTKSGRKDATDLLRAAKLAAADFIDDESTQDSAAPEADEGSKGKDL